MRLTSALRHRTYHLPPTAVTGCRAARAPARVHAARVVRVKRAYDEPDPADGRRVLVDRLWPRGLTKQAAAVDEWLRDVAPSSDLRRWYGHAPARFAEFTHRYRTELADRQHADSLHRLRTLAQAGPLTLLTAARDVEHAHTAVLVDLLTNSVDQTFDSDTEQTGRFVADKRPHDSRTSD
ncbi:DUF488 family protein [Planosporangium flavigriseum]|nr:DUF488 family protein [Planosporangium flavigriseum]NJC66651.1 DUF488 family protein [Planosporangium flavigriseum]